LRFTFRRLQKDKSFSPQRTQRAQKACFDRINRIIGIILFQSIKNEHLVNPVDPVQLTLCLRAM